MEKRKFNIKDTITVFFKDLIDITMFSLIGVVVYFSALKLFPEVQKEMNLVEQYYMGISYDAKIVGATIIITLILKLIIDKFIFKGKTLSKRIVKSDGLECKWSRYLSHFIIMNLVIMGALFYEFKILIEVLS